MSLKVNTHFKSHLTSSFIPRKTALSTAMTIALFAGSSHAATMPELQSEIKTLKTQVNALADEIKVGSDSSAHSQFASKTNIGGYGELHYNNIEGKTPEVDFHRFVLFFGHDFNEKIRFFSEFELEHSIAGEGEIELEQAYIEMDLTKQLKTRVGITLVPVGILNETHEPNTFYGTERNPVEKEIIPATWWSAGASLNGITDSGLSYDLVVSEGLNVADDDYTIRSGRQKSSKAEASDLAYTGRIKYTGIPGLELAATARYESNISQSKNPDAGAATLLETHVIYSKANFTAKALYAQWNIEGNAAKSHYVDKQYGYYLEPSYKLSENWGVFARYNEWNTTTVDAYKQTQTDFGVNYWPHKQVVFKADYQLKKDGSTEQNGINLGVGYSF
jgi:outer membrane murein-binding lipoprotein Lpp